MLRTVWAIFMIGGMAAWGQTQNDTSSGADKVDRAAAYYHYTMAVMYAKMAAASGGRNKEYVNKAVENYKAAIKADPQTEEFLQRSTQKDLTPLFPRPVRSLPLN